MRSPLFFLLLAFICGVIYVLILLSTGEQTPKESALLSIILTILSITGTWIASHWYSRFMESANIDEIKKSYQDNLRMYALKAAEKVMNSSSELSRLSSYLQDSLQDTEVDEPETCVRISNERILGAVQMVATLKSFHDTSLSDWEGVIGEELNKKREQQEEREDDIRDLVEKVQEILSHREDIGRFQTIDSGTLEKNIDLLRHDLRAAATGLYGYPFFGHKPRSQPRQRVTHPCPVCGEMLKLRTDKKGRVRYKGVQCSKCETKLIAKSDDSGEISIEHRREIEEKPPCYICGVQVRVVLDNIAGSFVRAECETCGVQLHISRTKTGISTSLLRSDTDSQENQKITPEFYETVREKLPEQPWPPGVHKIVATELGVSNSQVSKAIQYLIATGAVENQKDGIILPGPEPLENSEPPDDENEPSSGSKY